MELYTRRESQVRSYSRSYPKEFVSADGSRMTAADGSRYIDFLAGCGSLNYGHNHPVLRDAAIDYLASGGIGMGLDLFTRAKSAFLAAFETHVLVPRGLDYRLQFPGPTGTNGIEAAIKLARKVTGRTNIVAFTNAFHGCTLGALALTGNMHHRASSEAVLHNVIRHPYDRYHGDGVDTADQLERLLSDPGSGVRKPAAIIFEPVQGEGGLNAASRAWASKIARIARQHGALLIADEIQCGCGRTGSFFAFEPLGITPDIVVLSKSLSGFGLPLSLVLIAPEHDTWSAGEHNGTFRGTSLSLVTATAALDTFWRDDAFEARIAATAATLRAGLERIAAPHGFALKGRGMMLGIDTRDEHLAGRIKQAAFEAGLILETCGPHDEIVKCMPALTIADADLDDGLALLAEAFARAAPLKEPAPA